MFLLGGEDMKRKFIYLIISCVFALITTISINTENISSALREKETNIVLIVNNEKGNVKNYTTLNINKIEPQKRIVEEREEFYPFNDSSNIEVITKTEGLFPNETKKINLIFNISILSRYESRVLRL